MTKTKLSQNTITSKEKSEPLGWGAVIADAEAEIRASRQRITHLKASIRLFKMKLESGEPLPDGLAASTHN